ncbi:MAG: hypothetical protein LIP16_18980 [Clostridium sp.]|nr:hypothetical protein [Clostridium sp.]
MDFGKRVCEILAVIAALLLIGVLVWYISSGMKDRGYEKEGTLVWEEQETDAGEPVFPAFVTNPRAMIYGEEEIQRSGKGL